MKIGEIWEAKNDAGTQVKIIKLHSEPYYDRQETVVTVYPTITNPHSPLSGIPTLEELDEDDLPLDYFSPVFLNLFKRVYK